MKIAGGLIVALDIINTLHSCGKYNITLICPDTKPYRELSVDKKHTPNLLLKFYLRFILDFFWIPQIIKKNNPELVISLGNLPAISKTKQVLFSDNAFLSERRIFKLALPLESRLRHILRKRLFLKRIKYLYFIYVQTEIERKRFLALRFNPNLIRVLPPLLPSHLKSKVQHILPSRASNDILRLVCVSNYFPHKKIDVLKEVLELAAEEKFPLQIVFMLNAKRIKGGKRIIQNLAQQIEQKQAINIGNQASKKIISIIQQCDGVILPSLIETFGLNCLEAWYSRKPYFVSDLPWAQAVCGNAAIYINPIDARQILNKIRTAFSSETKLNEVVESGSKKIDLWPDSSKLLAEIEKCFEK